MSQLLIERKVAAKLDINMKAANRLVNATLEAIREGIIEDAELRLEPIGTFKQVERAPRKGRNFQTGQFMTIPGKIDVKLNIYRNLEEALNPEPDPEEFRDGEAADIPEKPDASATTNNVPDAPAGEEPGSGTPKTTDPPADDATGKEEE